MKGFLLLIFMLVGYSVYAQHHARLYKTIDDYKSGEYISDTLELNRKQDGQTLYKCDCKIQEKGDKKSYKTFNKEYSLIYIKDSLYVNCNTMYKDNFGYSFYTTDDHIFFVGCAADLETSPFRLVENSLLSADARFTYALNLSDGKVYSVSKKLMKQLIGDNDTLLKQYKRDPWKFTTERVYYYLTQLYE